MGCLKLEYYEQENALEVNSNFFGEALEKKGYSDFFRLKAYPYGYNGMEKDDEIKGSGNSYDFGARIQDPRLGRWLSVDPKAAKYTSLSPYHFGYNNPIITIDPNGEENIVVTSEEKSKGRFKYNFVEPAIKQLKDYQAKDESEKTTWVVMNHGYSTEEINKFKDVAEDMGVGFVLMDTKEQLTNYLNSGSVDDSKLSEARLGDKITDFSIYGHGGKWGDIWLDYDKQGKEGFVKADVRKLNAKAFDNAEICLYSCNSATPNSQGNSLSSVFATQTKSKVIGFKGKSDYSTINIGEGYLDKFSRWKNGFNAYGSQSQPTPGFFGSGDWYPTDDDGNKIPAEQVTIDETKK